MRYLLVPLLLFILSAPVLAQPLTGTGRTLDEMTSDYPTQTQYEKTLIYWLRFIGTGIAFLVGGQLFRLVLLYKNQRNFWALLVGSTLALSAGNLKADTYYLSGGGGLGWGYQELNPYNELFITQDFGNGITEVWQWTHYYDNNAGNWFVTLQNSQDFVNAPYPDHIKAGTLAALCNYNASTNAVPVNEIGFFHCLALAVTTGNHTVFNGHYKYPADNDAPELFNCDACYGGDDYDQDGVPDVDDPDDDNDGLADEVDPCPKDATNSCPEAQEDCDQDGQPDYLDNDPGPGCWPPCDPFGQGHALASGGVDQLKQDYPDCDYDQDGCRNADDPDPEDPQVKCPTDNTGQVENPEAPECEGCVISVGNLLGGYETALRNVGIDLTALQNPADYPCYIIAVPMYESDDWELEICPDFQSSDGSNNEDLETVRLFARGFATVLIVWIFTRKTFAVLLSY